jgi:predicted TIM-barrel fold metal-dependent hydrolase
MNTPIEIFVSAAATPEDRELLAKLDAYLGALGPGATAWHRGRAAGAEDEDREAAARLARAHVIVLLVSLDYLASATCRAEVERAVARSRAGEARVIPLHARPSPWQGQPFAIYQGLPRSGKPVSVHADPDRAWSEIVGAIGQVVRALRPRGEGPAT